MKKKPELRQLRQLRITEAIFLKKNLNYVNYVITPITQLQKRQNHPLVLPLVNAGGRTDISSYYFDCNDGSPMYIRLD